MKVLDRDIQRIDAKHILKGSIEITIHKRELIETENGTTELIDTSETLTIEKGAIELIFNTWSFLDKVYHANYNQNFTLLFDRELKVKTQ